MSTPEVRSSIKWSAIRSKAVPSNLMRPSAYSVSSILSSAEVEAKSKDKTVRPSKESGGLPHSVHKAAAFAGGTGPSRI